MKRLVGKENGAVHVGNMGLILPVRVRTCAENVGRTGSSVRASWGCSQCVPVMGVTERPASVTLQGGVPAKARASFHPVGEAWDQAPRLGPRRGKDAGYPLRLLWCVALSCGENGDSFRPDEVPRRLCSLSRASAIYKAMPKGRVMRRICEAVSGSTDSWDGSRAVVASRLFEGSETRNRFK